MSNIIEEIFNIFLSIENPRSGRNKIHDLVSLIRTSFCAVLSGIDSFLGIEDFVEIHFEGLSKYFNLKGKVPSHDTYQRFRNCSRRLICKEKPSQLMQLERKKIFVNK